MPIEVPHSIWHGFEIFLILQPTANLFGQITYDVPIKWRVRRDQYLPATRSAIPALLNLDYIPNNLLYRSSLRKSLQSHLVAAFELEDSYRVAGVIVSTKPNTFVKSDNVRSISIFPVNW